MKLQDVILRAMAKKITWLEAAEIIGVCDRTMRRMRERYEEFGYDGLFDQRRRKRTTLRVPMETAERVLALYRDTYFDLSVRHFHEKLREEHAIELSYTWVKQALQGAGLVARRKKRGSHRRRRPRRPMPGMLLHIDGSKHRWFSDDRYYDLLVILDDATSAIDARTEESIHEALRGALGTKTVLLVAHRESTLRLADRIVVLDHGRIAEQGTLPELLRRNGVFAGYYRTQFLTESEPSPVIPLSA